MEKSNGSKIPADGGARTVLPVVPMPAPVPMQIVNAPPPFLTKIYEMMEDSSCDKIVSWSATNNSFIVWDPPEFGRTILPKYFKHNNFSSFVRQLNSYGFRKVDPDRWEFANEGFLRGQRHLLRTIVRRRPAHGQNQKPPQPHGHSSSVGACVEVGSFGLEEEVERLNRDKNVLMQEIFRLRQRQQTTDDQLQAMMKRLQEMEQRQQQIMSFLAMALNSPDFFSQFIPQQGSSRRLEEDNKRRRLKPDCIPNYDSGTPADGQIIKYQAYVNEDAKALLSQIKNLNASPRLEKSGLDRVLSDILSVSNALDYGSSPTCTSGVALSDVPPISAHSYVSSASGVTPNGPSTSISEIQALQPAVTSHALAATQFPDVSSLVGAHELPSVSLPLSDINFPNLSKLQEMVLENNVSNPSKSNDVFLDPTSLVVQPMSLDIGVLSPDPGINWDNSLLDEMQPQFTLGDPSWEEFLAPILVAGEGEEMDSTPLVNPTQMNEAKTLENVWSTAQMQELAEQMGHLSSDTKKV